jgi:hypothetical protein
MASAQQGLQNLSGLVNTDVSNILNAEGRPVVRSLFSSDSSQIVRSDSDEQLLINVVFKTTVKIKAITITAPDGEERPAVVKLFVNQVRTVDCVSFSFSFSQVGRAQSAIARTARAPSRSPSLRPHSRRCFSFCTADVLRSCLCVRSENIHAQRHMDFDNASSLKPVQELKLTPAMTAPQKM